MVQCSNSQGIAPFALFAPFTFVIFAPFCSKFKIEIEARNDLEEVGEKYFRKIMVQDSLLPSLSLNTRAHMHAVVKHSRTAFST